MSYFKIEDFVLVIHFSSYILLWLLYYNFVNIIPLIINTQILFFSEIYRLFFSKISVLASLVH